MPAKRFAERDRSIIIAYLSGDMTRKALAQKHGMTYSRIVQIVEHQLKRLKVWKKHRLIKVHKIVGVLIDPDGIDGSVLQEWTLEQQWKEFEVSDGHC
jgi:hypothetical protein